MGRAPLCVQLQILAVCGFDLRYGAAKRFVQKPSFKRIMRFCGRTKRYIFVFDGVDCRIAHALDSAVEIVRDRIFGCRPPCKQLDISARTACNTLYFLACDVEPTRKIVVRSHGCEQNQIIVKVRVSQRIVRLFSARIIVGYAIDLGRPFCIHRKTSVRTLGYLRNRLGKLGVEIPAAKIVIRLFGFCKRKSFALHGKGVFVVAIYVVGVVVSAVKVKGDVIRDRAPLCIDVFISDVARAYFRNGVLQSRIAIPPFKRIIIPLGSVQNRTALYCENRIFIGDGSTVCIVYHTILDRRIDRRDLQLASHVFKRRPVPHRDVAVLFRRLGDVEQSLSVPDDSRRLAKAVFKQNRVGLLVYGEFCRLVGNGFKVVSHVKMRHHFIHARFRLRVVFVAYAHALRQIVFNVYAMLVSVPGERLVIHHDIAHLRLLYRESGFERGVVEIFLAHRRANLVHARVNVLSCRRIGHARAVGQVFNFQRMRISVIRHRVRFKHKVGKIR